MSDTNEPGTRELLGALREILVEIRGGNRRTHEALAEIRDGVLETNVRLDQTNSRLDQTNSRLDQMKRETNTRIDRTNAHLEALRDETREELTGVRGELHAVAEGLVTLNHDVTDVGESVVALREQAGARLG